MKTNRIQASLALLAVAACSPALAQNGPWSVHVGPAAVRLSVKAAPESPRGTPIPGSALEAENGTTLGLEVGYDITPDWTGRLTVGVPLKTTITGSGSLAALGKAGELTYGPAVLSSTYRLGQFGAVRPYVGAGVAYLMAFSSKDAAVADFNVKNAFGSAIQIGADIALGSNYGLFIDVKKIFLKTTVTGTVPAFGGAPAYSRVSVNPLVVHAGLSYRF